MEITLTPAQWEILKGVVAQGVQAEARLGLPIEIVNGDEKIEITAEETKITLSD